MRYAVDVGDRTVGYHRAGTGPAVVLIGALTHSTAPDRALIDELAAAYTVVAVDPPGYGLSDPLPTGADDVPAVAAALHTTLDVIGLDSAALVARFTGGTVALELARRDPARFPLLVLDDVPLLDAGTRSRWAREFGEPIIPQRDGSHLIRHWYRRRQAFVSVPWFDPSAALDIDLSSPDVLDSTIHAAVVDALATADHTLGDRIAFAHDTPDALRTSPVTVRALRPSHPNLGAPDVIRADVRIVPAGPELPARRSAILAALDGWRAPQPGPVPVRPVARGRWTVQLPATPWGQVAARRFRPDRDTGRPLVLLHASPLSGESLRPLAGALATTGREVVVLDTLGAGDSDRPDPERNPEFRITDLARAALAALAAIGVEQADVFGTHTGAMIALEMGLADPARVHAMVLDGLPLLEPHAAAALLEDYLVDLTPRWDAAHLAVAWSNVLDVLTWYPWHARDPAHRRALTPPDVPALHRRAVQVLKGGMGYLVPHGAVARHRTAQRLPLLRVPVAFCRAPADPMAGYVQRCVDISGAGQVLDLAADHSLDAVRIGAWLDAVPTRSEAVS